MEKKYRVLRIVATIFKVLAWIVLVVGLLVAIIWTVALMASGVSRLRAQLPSTLYYPGLGLPLASGLAGSLVLGLISILYFLFLYASGEFVFLLLDIEENTREAALEQDYYDPESAGWVRSATLKPESGVILLSGDK